MSELEMIVQTVVLTIAALIVLALLRMVVKEVRSERARNNKQ